MTSAGIGECDILFCVCTSFIVVGIISVGASATEC
jgi:hypothetical protein